MSDNAMSLIGAHLDVEHKCEACTCKCLACRKANDLIVTAQQKLAEMRGAGGVKSSSKTVAKQKKTPAPSKPKKAKTPAPSGLAAQKPRQPYPARTIFARERNPQLVATVPSASDRKKRVAEEWKAMSAVNKKRYLDLAANEKAEYKTKLSEWQAAVDAEAAAAIAADVAVQATEENVGEDFAYKSKPVPQDTDITVFDEDVEMNNRDSDDDDDDNDDDDDIAVERPAKRARTQTENDDEMEQNATEREVPDDAGDEEGSENDADDDGEEAEDHDKDASAADEEDDDAGASEFDDNDDD